MQCLHAITDNLSKALQQKKMSALRRKELADSTVQILANTRNEHDFNLLYKKLKASASEIEAISPPALPRKRRKPTYSILHYVTGSPEATAAANPENPYEHYKPVYYKALDSIANAIKDRFDQATFKLFTQAKHLFLKALNIQDVRDELKVLETHFKDDYDADSLTSELQLLPISFQCEPINLEEVAKVLKSLSREKRMLVGNCVTVKKIILTAGATSATPGDSS